MMIKKPDENCIMFFVKYPEKGRVKTRLSAELDENVTFELYKRFVVDMLSMLEEFEFNFRICFSPEDSHGKFTEWLGRRYCYIPQHGADLGQKMKNALLQAFRQDFSRAVIIGSDIPDLPGEIISKAFLSLRTHDAVIGPASDGGYYLIGFNCGKFVPEAFDGIQWSSDTVFRETLSKLDGAGIEACKLPEWRDVDTFADLKSMFLRSRHKEFSSSRTMSYIAGKPWLLQRLSQFQG